MPFLCKLVKKCAKLQIEPIRVVMTVYFTTIFEGYHLKIKLLKKSHNFYFPAKCNNWGRSIKIHDKIVKLVHNVQKNRYIRTHFSFFLATPYLLSYPLQSFGGKFKIVNFYKQLDFYMVPLKFVSKIHHHYYSRTKICVVIVSFRMYLFSILCSKL